MHNVIAGDTVLELIAVGSYTSPHGRAQGIGLISFEQPQPGRRFDTIASCDSPSFLAAHPHLPVVYSVHEFEQTVDAHTRASERGALAPLGSAAAAGAAA